MTNANADPFIAMVSQIASRAGVDLNTVQPAADGPRIIHRSGVAPVPVTTTGEQLEIFRPGLYDCPVCQNYGSLIWVGSDRIRRAKPCSCLKIRKSLIQAEKSGLGEMVTRYTFEAYVADTPWRKSALKTAREFADRGTGWFFYGGRSGTGKTHLCVAICRELMARGFGVRYMTWVDDAAKAKQAVNDPAMYQGLVQSWKNADVLYIDDLFKAAPDTQISQGDRRLAYELINARYLDQSKITVISSEKILEQVIGVDEAIGSRIAERAMPYILNSAKMDNWRLTRRQ